MDSDPDPAIFVIDLQGANKLVRYLQKKGFGYYFLCKGTFTPFFKDKKSKISHKTVGTKVFLTSFA
jgi:hypothetical protein